MIHTFDTDILVLARAAVQLLSITELWVPFATGKGFRYLSSHEMAGALGPLKCKALQFYTHSVGVTRHPPLPAEVRGLREKYGRHLINEVAPKFCTLAATPSTDDDQLWGTVIVLLYDRASSEMMVNEARKQLFSQR